MELWQSWCTGWCLARHTDKLISFLPISLMQVSLRAQGQEKGSKLSDTEVTGLQGEPELAGKNGECSWEAAEKLGLREALWDDQPDPRTGDLVESRAMEGTELMGCLVTCVTHCARGTCPYWSPCPVLTEIDELVQ